MSNYVNNTGQIRLGWRVPTQTQLQTATYLLDSYGGTTAALSLRKLISGYNGSAIRVRRSIDNAETNIGFDSGGNLDTTSLMNFVATDASVNTPILDTYTGSIGAYSLRRIKTGATASIRVRRSSDNQETDIGFDSTGNLNTSTLLSFVGSGNGYVKTWYDQSGLGRHANQTTAARQPWIVNSGNLYTDSEGRPRIWFFASWLSIPTTVNLTGESSIFIMGNGDGVGSGYSGFICYNANDNPELRLLMNGNAHIAYWNNAYVYQGSTNTSTKKAYAFTISGTSTRTFRSWSDGVEVLPTTGNGSYTTSGFSNATEFTIGGYIRTSGYHNGYMNEMIVYGSNKTSDVQNISLHQRSYWFSGASYVTTWYDQSGLGTNAVQTTANYQPMIVDNGSIITRNGKPSIKFDGVNDRLRLVTSGSVRSVFTTFCKDELNWSGYKGIISWRNALSAGLPEFSASATSWQFTGIGPVYGASGETLNSMLIYGASVSVNGNNRNVTDASNYTKGSRLDNRNSGQLNSVSTHLSSTLSGSKDICLGADLDQYDNRYLNGAISEIILYSSDKTSDNENINSNILNNWSTAPLIVRSGMVLNVDPSITGSYIGSGTSAYDLSFSNYSFSLMNGVGYTASNGGAFTFVQNNITHLERNGGGINVGNKFTVQLWTKISKFGGNEGGMWKRAGLINNSWNWSGNQGFTIMGSSQWPANGNAATPGKETLFLSVGQDQWGVGTTQGYMTPYVDNWVNVSVVVNGTALMKIYVNGVEPTYAYQQNGPADGVLNYNLNYFYIGRTNQDILQGSIGSVYMYNRPLSQTEIQQNFNATKSKFGY